MPYINRIKQIFLMVLILCSFLSCKDEKRVNISRYNELIDSAEINILNHDYKKALLNYQEAENHIKSMFARDLNNALITSIHLEEWDLSVHWSRGLLQKGIGQPFFNRPIFMGFKNTPEWDGFEKDFSEYGAVFKERKDQQLIDSLDILHKIDQQNYCLIPTGKIKFSDAAVKTVFLDSLFCKLIENRGFPSEELIGVNVVKDTFISPLPRFFSLLRHSYQANSDILRDYLSNAVENGLLNQEVYEEISGIDDMKFVVIDCKIYKDKLKPSDSTGNALFKRKVIYNNSNMDRGYFFYAPLAILEGTTRESLGSNFDLLYEFIADYSNCKQ